MDTDIRDERERSLGGGPPIDRPTGALVRRGRPGTAAPAPGQAGAGARHHRRGGDHREALIATGGVDRQREAPDRRPAPAAPRARGPRPYDVGRGTPRTGRRPGDPPAPPGPCRSVPGLEVVTLLRNPWGIDQGAATAVALKVRYRGHGHLGDPGQWTTAAGRPPSPSRSRAGTFQKWAGANPPYLDPNDDPDASAYPGDAPPPATRSTTRSASCPAPSSWWRRGGHHDPPAAGRTPEVGTSFAGATAGSPSRRSSTTTDGGTSWHGTRPTATAAVHRGPGQQGRQDARRLPGALPAAVRRGAEVVCCEGRRARRSLLGVRRRPPHPPAPDRLRHLRGLAPRRRPGPDGPAQAVRRLAGAATGTAARRPTCAPSSCAPTSTSTASRGDASGRRPTCPSALLASELPVEDRSALFEALQELPPMQRKVVVLRHWLGAVGRGDGARAPASARAPSRATARGAWRRCGRR